MRLKVKKLTFNLNHLISIAYNTNYMGSQSLVTKTMTRHLSFVPLVSLLIIFSSVISQSKPVVALTLHTNSRWIVNEAGQRVKLACVNWVSHMEPMVAEGLNKQPLDAISKRIVSMGFNCVRLTWPIYLVTNESLASLTVRQSFQRVGLSQYIAGIQAKNPSIIDVSLIKAFQVR